MKIDFIIAGTQKGGTTALHRLLTRHPQIHMARRKEVHFFNNKNFFWPMPKYGIYHSFWRPLGVTEDRLLGEATPNYMCSTPCAVRIASYSAQMKLIFILRNPVERAYSEYQMRARRGRESLSFEEVVNLELQEKSGRHYIRRGYYAEQIERFLRYFPRQQLLFLKTEDLRHHQRATIGQCCEFLGINNLFLKMRTPLARHEYEPMRPETRRTLIQHMSAGISRLELLLNWNCSSWYV